jgi:hypothetical protein
MRLSDVLDIPVVINSTVVMIPSMDQIFVTIQMR